MQVDVYSRTQMLEVEPDEDTCLISISTPDTDYAEYGTEFIQKVGWHAVLELSYNDITYHTQPGDGWMSFAPFMASRTYDFITKHSGKPFVIHCDLGVSRSVATAAYMRDYLKYEMVLHAIEDDSKQNSLVYSLMEKEHEVRQGS